MREPLNVGRDGCADLPVLELGCLALREYADICAERIPMVVVQLDQFGQH
jgi:hypothetical protein